MTITLPMEQGISDKIMDAIVDLITLKLQTEVSATDASRLSLIKVGPKQDDPSGVDILIHENDPENPRAWPHKPIRYKVPRRQGGFVGRPYEQMQSELRALSGYELVGGGSQMAYAYTAEIEIWGDEIADIEPERRDVGQLASLVANRFRKALQDAGPKIGQDDLISDDFGSTTQRGPIFNEVWTDYEEGEALIVRMYLRFYYVCVVSWSTDAW